MKNNNKIMDYYRVCEQIDDLMTKYSFLSVSSIGQTVLGKRIPIINVGKGKKTVLYVGAQSGTDRYSAECLLRYIDELCCNAKNEGRVYNCSVSYLLETRCISVIPMLNPDGVDICLNGIEKENPLYERFQSKQIDFSVWQGNALGVDLRKDYGECFDDVDSKSCSAESGALRNYLMFNQQIRMLICLGRGNQSVRYTYEENAVAKLNSLGKALGSFCGSAFEQKCEKGTLGGFCAKELGIPCYEIFSEYKNSDDSFSDYLLLRKALFLAPTLV